MASSDARTSRGLLGVSIGLGVVILLLWVVALATLSDLNGSDAAGNGLAQVFGAAELILIWVLLAVLLLVAGASGKIPTPAVFVALVLVPASGFAALTSLYLLATPNVSPFLWPIVVPALIPPLVVAFCLWALLPALQSALFRAICRRDCLGRHSCCKRGRVADAANATRRHRS